MGKPAEFFSRRFLQVAILVVFVAIVAVTELQTNAVAHRLSEKTACQARYNAAVATAITTRAQANSIIQSAADQDRDNIVKLITTISTARVNTTVSDAIKLYLNEETITAEQRDSAIATQLRNPIPDVSQLQNC